jgi:hypothetical protein
VFPDWWRWNFCKAAAIWPNSGESNRSFSDSRCTGPPGADCQRAYHDFAAYHLSHGLDLLDALIGHTAVGVNQPLATFNVKHYGIIAGLQTVQPY